MRSVEILVAGAGASGLAAAIEAARQGKKVFLLEKNEKLGKKILATGNGRCNFTNLHQEVSCYCSDEPETAWEIFRAFDHKKTIRWFEEIGVLAKEKNGYVYPASFQATAVQRALEREVHHLGVEVCRECEVQSVERHFSYPDGNVDGYVVTAGKNAYFAHNVILSTGGLAAPAHGSTGDGYGFLKDLGLKCVPPSPALTSLCLCGKHGKQWAGCRIYGNVSLFLEDKTIIAQESGELQFVSYGISGIPIFQLSRHAGRMLEQGRRVFLTIDSVPELTEEQLGQELMKRKKHDGDFLSGSLLESILPDAFAKTVLTAEHISLKTKVKDITPEQIKKAAYRMKHFSVEVSGVSSFEKAQTTAGGIALSEVNPETMEVHKAEGLYLTGELLDVDGICGGYNLQWAWTTGIIAGRSAGKKKRDKR